MINQYQQQPLGQQHFSSPQAVFQPGFAGTDAQQVRQQNAQSFQGQQQYGLGQQGPQTQYGYQQPQGQQHFTGPQAVFQPGFAGTDAQQVRQQLAQSQQYATGFQPPYGYQQPYGQQQFTSPQAVFQPGFTGTNVQQVRQQNAQSFQNQQAPYQQQPVMQQQYGQQPQGQQQFTSPQAVFQPGFSGTDAQQVRQQNAQSIQQSPQSGLYQ
jgi:hypothetical protein